MSPSAGDRDRLAADLYGLLWSEPPVEGHFDSPEEWFMSPNEMADRLIALGWTQRPLGYWSAEGDLYPEMVDRLRDVLPEAWAQGKQIVVADGVTLRFHELPPTLDEERLARALVRERVIWTSEEGGPKPERKDRKRAAAIAKAYREDTDASDV